MELFLSDRKARNWLFFYTYFTQGLIQGYVLFTVIAYMTKLGTTAKQLSLLTFLFLLPWTLKFIFGPILDWAVHSSMGKRRPWLILSQTIAIMIIISFSMIQMTLENYMMVCLLCFGASAATIFQDLSIDALIVEYVPKSFMSRISGYIRLFTLTGLGIGGGLSAYLFEQYNFTIATISIAAFFGISVLSAIFIRESSVDSWLSLKKMTSSTATGSIYFSDIFKSLWLMCKDSKYLTFFLCLLCSQIGYGLIQVFSYHFFIVDLDWSDVYYSKFISSMTLVGGILGAILVILLSKYINSFKLIIFSILLYSGYLLLFVLLKNIWLPQDSTLGSMLISTLIFIFIFSNALQFISIVALCYQLTNKAFAATQFSIMITLFNLSNGIGLGASGLLSDYVQGVNFFIVAAVIHLLTILLWFNFINHARSVTEGSGY